MANRGPNTIEGKAKAMENLQKGMWKKGESGNSNGRPRRALHELCEKTGVDFQVSLSREDKMQILESMLEMSIEELKLIATDSKSPAFMVLVASALRADIADGKMYSMNSLFDRFFGMPEQRSKMQLVGDDGGPLITSVVIVGSE